MLESLHEGGDGWGRGGRQAARSHLEDTFVHLDSESGSRDARSAGRHLWLHIRLTWGAVQNPVPWPYRQPIQSEYLGAGPEQQPLLKAAQVIQRAAGFEAPGAITHTSCKARRNQPLSLTGCVIAT